MLTLWLVECLCKLALKLSSIIFVLASLLFVAAGVFCFTHGSALNGCIGLVIAFLVSPCGLPMLAVKFVSACNEFAERRTKHVPESEHVPITEFSEEKAIISGPMRHLRQAGDLRYSHINFRAALI